MTQRRPGAAWLAAPFPPVAIRRAPGGGDYITHALISQKLLAWGHYDLTIVQVLREDLAPATTGVGTDRERTWDAVPNAIVGVIARLQMTVDGHLVTVEDVGSCEGAYMEPNDGERLKKALSDALKRCARHLGVGLQTWSRGQYPLASWLPMGDDVQRDPGAIPEADPEAIDPDDPSADPDGLPSRQVGAR